MSRLSHYELLADLFDYPGPDYFARIRATRKSLTGRYSAAALNLGEFAGLLPVVESGDQDRALAILQEIYTRTFDVQSITSLDVGYMAFGDDYKRGEFLVNLNREQRAAGVDCGNELSDYLPNVLRLIARWQDPELVKELIQVVLVPVLRKMLREFGPERMEERNALYEKHYKSLIVTAAERATIYRHALAALLSVIEKDFRPVKQADVLQANDFLGSIRREMEIDDSMAP